MGFEDPHCLEVWRRCMSRWIRYHSRKTVANLLREESREVQEFIAGDDEELRALLGLDGKPKGLLVEEVEPRPQQTQLSLS